MEIEISLESKTAVFTQQLLSDQDLNELEIKNPTIYFWFYCYDLSWRIATAKRYDLKFGWVLRAPRSREQ